MDKIIIKHIVEIRLFKRLFSFSDFSGELTDFFIKKLGVNKIRATVDGTRIDVASDDLKKVFFVSYENFGLQIEGSDSFVAPFADVDNFFNLLNEFGKYKFNSIARIGVKSLIFFHVKGNNLENNKGIYRKYIFSNQEMLEEKTGTELYDFAYTFDLKNKDGIANVLTGPTTKEEVIKEFFGQNECYKEFGKENGLFFSIDFGKNKKKDDMLLEDIKVEVRNNFENIEKIFKGFLNYFEINENGK